MMTIAVCTNCGEMKQGAWCICPVCDSEGLDPDISILLSDHNLSETELHRIGNAIRVIHETRLDEETRFHLLAYFLFRKWPKLLDYDIDAVAPEFQKKLDNLYRSTLAHLGGQEDLSLKVSPIREHRWISAMGPEFQAQEDAWQAEIKEILMNGMAIAKQVVILKIQAGEGAVLQRLLHGIRTIFHACDYRRLAARATELIGDAREYRRAVNEFCSRVKNGWSDRTKEQAGYFRGLCQRLEEMAEGCKIIIEHKAGINTLINIDLDRSRQQLRQSYKMFIELSYVVMDPTRINQNGTCRTS